LFVVLFVLSKDYLLNQALLWCIAAGRGNSNTHVNKMPYHRRGDRAMPLQNSIAVNFDTYRIVQQHRAVSLPQHGFLVGLCLQTFFVFVCNDRLSVKKWQIRTSQIAYLTSTSNHVITLNYYSHHYSPPA